MDPLQKEIDAIEKELLQLIIQHLRENKIEAAKAQQLAKDFLAILPIADQKDLLEKLKNLSGTYDEIKTLYIEELAKVDDMKREEVLTHMRNAIHTGNIENAISVAKAYTEKKGDTGL